MSPTLMKIAALLLIFFGEIFVISSEIIGAHMHGVSHAQFAPTFAKTYVLMAVGGAFMVAGYILGFRAFQNIWIVSAVSITSVLFLEPALNIIIFRQLPTTGAAIGLLFGCVGFIAALL